MNPSGLSLSECAPLISTLERVFLTRGMVSGFAFVKAVRLNVLNYLSGNPERDRSVKLSAHGIPACLGPLRKVVAEQSPDKLRFVLTILFSTRALKTRPDPSIEPIVGPSNRGNTYSGLSMFVVEFWKQLGYRRTESVPRSLFFKRFHLSTKSGPNPVKRIGTALNSWYTDLKSIGGDKPLMDAICVLGGGKMRQFIDLALVKTDILDNIFPFIEDGNLRKLSYFSDKEGKTRVVAIGDYFSQTVLRRLHSYLFRVLKKIPQDMTFDQGAFVERIQG